MARHEALTFDRLAAPYDRGMAPLEKLWLRRMRIRLLPHVRGKTLEVGVGTGANFPFYPPSARPIAIDESVDMLGVAARRAQALDHRAGFCQMDVEHLAFRSSAFDTVVATLLLCSVVDQPGALEELRRVLRQPGGRLLLLEHMRPRVRPLALLADLADVPWYAMQGRCHLNRETQASVTHAGFEVEFVEARVGGLLRLIVARTV
jgi:ubiquinone/menaquinone biosynthesis C-methylase UbiE